MPQTNYLEDPSRPGHCKNCGKPKDVWHGGERFASKGETCDRSRAYVWRTLRAEDVPVMQAALKRLQTYTLAKDGHLRIVPRGATGDDSWAHSYGFHDIHRQKETHAAIMDGWVAQYTGTLEKMATAWEFFEYGWWNRDAVPVKVDLKHESAWVLCVGTLTIYVSGKGEVPVPHYASSERYTPPTPTLDKAHGFKSRKAALEHMTRHEDWYKRIVNTWGPKAMQRIDFR